MPSVTELCRELRRRETKAENILWQELRNRKFRGMKFLRQHPIYIRSASGSTIYYIPDFYCAEAKLVIEADGPVHQFKKEYDKNRDEVMMILGLNVLRFENEAILGDLNNVLNAIKKLLPA